VHETRDARASAKLGRRVLNSGVVTTNWDRSRAIEALPFVTPVFRDIEKIQSDMISLKSGWMFVGGSGSDLE
jgi:hypothetical protein